VELPSQTEKELDIIVERDQWIGFRASMTFNAAKRQNENTPFGSVKLKRVSDGKFVSSDFGASTVFDRTNAQDRFIIENNSNEDLIILIFRKPI
jgi:hypothetical protein